MPESTISCGLYPVVQDITEISEHGTWCCGDSSTTLFDNFSLQDLAMPIVSPRSIYEGGGGGWASPPSPPPPPPPPSSPVSLDPLSPELSSSEFVVESTSLRRQRYSPKAVLTKIMLKHRRQSSTSKLVEPEKGGKQEGKEEGSGCGGRKSTHQQLGRRYLHRRTSSSRSTISDTADSTTICGAREAEERVLVTATFRFHEVYVLTRQISRCNLSNVWECVHRHEGTRYCVKIIDRRRFFTLADEDSALREMAMLSSLATYHHPRIVQLIHTMEDANNFYIVTKLVEHGNLLTYLTQAHQQKQQHPYEIAQPTSATSDVLLPLTTLNIQLPRPPCLELEVKRLAKSLLEGVAFLHSLGICHHDLRPENLLVLEDNGVAICDFGCAVYLDGGYCCRGRCGNTQYAAPEVILGKPHGTISDMWSVGVILFHCLAGYPPFAQDVSRQKLKEKIIKGDFGYSARECSNTSSNPNVWDSISRPAKQFVSNLIHVDPQVRLTAREALEHPWLVSTPEHSPSLKSSKHHKRNSMVKRLFTMVGMKSSRQDVDMEDMQTASTRSSSFGSMVRGSAPSYR